MSDDRHPHRSDVQRGCTKRGFRSKSMALAANKSNGARLRAYLCDRCRLWHVTRQKRRDL